MPPKKNKPKITPGQLRGILREINQPPHNARQRKVPRNKPTPKRASGPVKRTQTGVKKTPSTIREEKYQVRKARLARVLNKLQQPPKRSKSPSKPRPITVSRRIPIKADVEGTGKRAVKYKGKVIYLTPGQIKGIFGKSGLDSPKNTVDILKRELNLTPGARARLDAEAARLQDILEREAQLDYRRQAKESARNPLKTTPPDPVWDAKNKKWVFLEPLRQAEVDREQYEKVRKIKKEEREEERRTGRKKKQRLLQETSDAIDKRSRRKIKEARQTRPSAPRGGIVPGAGGGLLPRIR